MFSRLLSFFRRATTPSGMKCVLGLGNPGEEYRLTRHNAGFRVAASLAHRLGGDLQKGKGDFLIARCAELGSEFLVVTPFTFMNKSGIAAEQITAEFGVDPKDFIVVCDDFQLPLGTLRMRERGGDGGHNGLASILRQLRTEEIPRLRIGIAGTTCPTENKKELMADYVLSDFEPGEVPVADAMVGHACDALLSWVHHGTGKTMNVFNKSFLRS